MGGTSAAVFIASASTSSSVDVTTVARVYGLTPAETRLLKYLMGAGLIEIAAALGITDSTAKTHRTHIFSAGEPTF